MTHAGSDEFKMTATHRPAWTGGLILIALGVVLLVAQIAPGFARWFEDLSWPLIVVAVGAGLLLLAVITNQPQMAIPAAIVGGIGCLLYWQNANNTWESWAYMWTLIPGFGGVGKILAGVLEQKWACLREGAWAILGSLLLFAIFSTFFGGTFDLGKYWPVLLILLGGLSLFRYFTGRPR